MIRCETCKHKELEGHKEPCINCIECGVPYNEDVPAVLLSDNYEEQEV